MEIILSAIAAGGLVGASDQYLCLLIVSVAAKTGLIQLASQMAFLSSWWFLGMVILFWLLSIAPAYASLLSPGVMNVINTIQKFLSGFLVPLSSALVALASAGVITSFNPELNTIIKSLRIFNPDGTLGITGWFIGGTSATVGLLITGLKAVTKPMLGLASGTTGHLAAPIFLTAENLLSVILMVTAYVLSKTDPWLLMVLLIVVILSFMAVFFYTFQQLLRLKRGVGKVLAMTESHPKAGWAIIAEIFVWGSGWMIWKHSKRGVMMLILWAGWLMVSAGAVSMASAAVVLFPFMIPMMMFLTGMILVFFYLGIGFGSAESLLKLIEKDLSLSSTVVHKP